MTKQWNTSVGPAHNAAFKCEHGGHGSPAAVLAAKDGVVANSDVVVPGRIGNFGAKSVHWLNRDARSVHRKDEHCEALVLGKIKVGASEEDQPLGNLRKRGPHLRTVDDPFIAIFHRTRFD